MKFAPLPSLLCILLLASTASAGEATSGSLPPVPAFRKVNKDQWFKVHTPPYGSYRPDNDPASAAQYYVSIGPVGVRGLQHDQEWARWPGFRKCFPKELLDAKGNLVMNCYEVLDVWADSPASGKLMAGDLVIAVNGRPLLSAREYRPDWTFEAKECRSLQLFLGDMVEESEGLPDGKMTFTVIRAGELRSANTTRAYAGALLRKGNEQTISVDISKASSIVLGADSDGSIDYDHINWVNPRLTGPKGDLNLTSLKWTKATAGWGEVSVGKNIAGKAITFNGKEEPNSIGTHAASVIAYDLPPGYTKLEVIAQGSPSGNGATSIKPFIDVIQAVEPFPALEKELFTAPVMRGDKASVEIGVDVTGQSELILRAIQADPKLPSNHLAWAEPRLVGPQGELPLGTTKWKRATTGWGEILTNGKDLNGAQISLNGKAVTNCIMVHAPSEVAFEIPAGYTRFKATGLTRHGGTAVIPVVSAKRGGQPQMPNHLAPYLATVTVNIPAVGRFSPTFPANCAKAKYMADYYAAFIAASQNEDGSWDRWAAYTSAVFDVTVNGLALLSTGDPKYDTAIRKAAYWVGYKATYDGWAVVRAMPLMFLSEYYLRTKDPGILPALKNALRASQETLLFDYSIGHGTRVPGYADGALLLGLSYNALALAIADKTPVGVDRNLLSGTFDYIDRIGCEGFIPYGRTFVGRRRNVEVPSNSPALTGGALIGSLVYGGRKSFVDGATRMYVAHVGAGDGNHATATLGQFWSGLSLANVDIEAFHRHMQVFKWKFNLSRTALDGFVQQANPMEYQGGEECMGIWWRTAGWVMALNAEKKNMAMTGAPQYRATKLIPDIAPIEWQYSAWRYFQRNWAIAESTLGSQCPKRLHDALAALDALPCNAEIHAKLYELVMREAPAICAELAADKTLKDELRTAAYELVLGMEQRIQMEQVSDDGSHPPELCLISTWPFRGYLYHAEGSKISAYKSAQPLPVKGTATVEDPQKLLGKSVTFKIDSTAKMDEWMTHEQKVALDLPKDTKPFTLPVHFVYKVGDLSLDYTTPALIFRKQPENTGDTRWRMLSARTIPVAGQVVRPPRGNDLVFRIGKREIGCMNPDFFAAEWNGRTYGRSQIWLDDGDECVFDYIPYTIWEGLCRRFVLQKRASRRLSATITATAKETKGNIAALSDDLPETACEFTRPAPGEPIVLTFDFGEETSINGAFLRAEGGGTFAVETETGTTWTAQNWNNNELNDSRTFETIRARKARFVINADRARIIEAHLYYNPKRSK